MEKIKSAVDKVIHPHSHEERAHPTTTTPLSTVATPLYSPTETMKAVEWHGKEDVRVGVRPKPLVTCPDDVVVKVTSTTICGSDLHLYYDQVPGVQVMKSGDIIGHEAMGIVDSIGPEVKSLKVGDRVVISCAIACGQCSYCQKGMFSCCDTTNPDGQMEKLYGHRTAALFGYSHLTGQYDGCQAEFVRVPHADVNCLKVTNQLEDEMLLFLSDVLCTGWHGNELAEVKAGDVVAVWGCGPIGLAALAWAKFRGASKLIAIDDVPYRLAIAQDKIGASIINFKDQDVIATIQTLVPGGPDCCIDCAGFRFPTSLGHRLQRTLRLETDALDIIAEMVKTVRKGGRIALIGDYFGLGNNFPIGAFMEKGLQMRGGQVFVQKYWHTLLSYIESGKFDPRFLVSHVMPLDQAPEAYKLFSNQIDNSVKIVLKPTGTTSAQPAVLPVR